MTLLHRIALIVVAALALAPMAQAGETWTQHPGFILGPTLEWEDDAVQEPSVIYEKGLYRMWYSGGGYGECYMGVAVSRDLKYWAKSSTPVLGNGQGGEKFNACHSNVQKLNGRYYAWYSNDSAASPNGHLWLAVSKDGVKWTKQPRPAIRATGWAHNLANTFVMRHGNRWLMFWEAQTENVGQWQMATATSTDLIHWTVNPQRLSTLGFGDTYGGPWVIREGDRWAMYYHAPTAVRTPGVFSLVFKATSRDLIHWTTSVVPLVSLEQDWQVDQVADPSVVRVDGRSLMFYDGLDNKEPLRSRIGLAELR